MSLFRLAVATLAGALGAGACIMKDPPATPTWAEDVQPLLLGNCFHCHGAEVGFDKDGMAIRSHGTPEGARYDIYDPMEYVDAVGDIEAINRLGVVPTRSPAIAGILVQLVKSKDPHERMPPPPGLPLSDYEIQVLDNWLKAKAPKGTRPDNSAPRAVLAGKPAARGPDLVVTFDVLDDDGDQVLGRIEGGTGKPQVISRSGRHTFTLPGAAGTTPRVSLSDGWKKVDADLK
jgi:hypothetical protein